MKYTALVGYTHHPGMEFAEADTIEQAVRLAVEKSAVNCFRTISVIDAEHRTVKGPYPLRPERSRFAHCSADNGVESDAGQIAKLFPEFAPLQRDGHGIYEETKMEQAYAIFTATDTDLWRESGLAHSRTRALDMLSQHKWNSAIAVAVPWDESRYLPASLRTADIGVIPGVIEQLISEPRASR